MFDVQNYLTEFQRRITSIRRLLNAVDPIDVDRSNPAPELTEVSREVRGLAILLLFASYENLLKSLCRGLLERAARLRVGNQRYKIGIRQFAVHKMFQSIVESPNKNTIWITRSDILACASSKSLCTIDANIFPSDGSFMKRSQVRLIFKIFDLGDPASILKEVWERLDTIVTQRNDIAHGNQTPDEVGRNYTSAEIRILVDKWEEKWLDVINHVRDCASERSFYVHNSRSSRQIASTKN
ncbi:HEPN domain-containing protein [Acidisphaera rubrifaciens]|uniref:HEPN domain-containing protein n=1 Tax=Acidisphaera rubrifaciens TaxID=50715 RepID=UPI0011DCF962|nr:HEPN domain-containing protein [Acidisphaera rubrifaciens]